MSEIGAPLRVAIADDAAIIRDGLARLLTDAGFEVVGSVFDGDSLLECVAKETPDVVIVDIRMPPTHTDEGLRAAQQIRSRYPNVGLLVLSQYDDAAYAIKLVSIGPEGTGYLLKERVGRVDQIVDAIHRVSAGESVIDPTIVERLVSRPREKSPIEDLTAREREILALMAEGRSNQGICDVLFVSMKTVNSHVHRIFTKLGLVPAASDHRRVLAVLAYLQRT